MTMDEASSICIPRRSEKDTGWAWIISLGKNNILNVHVLSFFFRERDFLCLSMPSICLFLFLNMRNAITDGCGVSDKDIETATQQQHKHNIKKHSQSICFYCLL